MKRILVSALTLLTLLPFLYGGCGGGSSNDDQEDDFKISGFVMLNSSGHEGVLITLTGTKSATSVTDNNGYYECNNLPDGTYLLTPSLDGYSFSPPSISVSISGASEGGINYNSTFVGYKISGNIAANSIPLENVEMTLSGGLLETTLTGSDGSYVFSSLHSDTYEITPRLLNYEFSPKNIQVDLSNSSIYGQNFSASAISSEYWIKRYSGGIGHSIQPTPDGGYIVAGETDVYGAGDDDYWIVKLDRRGIVEWEKAYGWADIEVAEEVVLSDDGGYVVVGYTRSFGGTLDIWVLKIDSDGSVDWSKRFDSAVSRDSVWHCSIQRTSDNGYIIGAQFSYEPTLMAVLKLNGSGTLLWHKVYGNGYYVSPKTIRTTFDNGSIIAGNMRAAAGSPRKCLVSKLDSGGEIVWQNQYGAVDDSCISITETSNGYVVGGSSLSIAAGHYDYWVMKLNSSGSIVWQSAYGGINGGGLQDIKKTTDSGYIVAGSSQSFLSGNAQSWVLKLLDSGTISWQKAYENSAMYSIHETPDNGFVMAGQGRTALSGPYELQVTKVTGEGAAPPIDIDTNVLPVETFATSKSANLFSINSFVFSTSDVVPYIENTSATVEQITP